MKMTMMVMVFTFSVSRERAVVQGETCKLCNNCPLQ
jgi:hypothetical protein